MDKRIFDLPDAPLPLDPDSYYEVLVPDGSSSTGYTSCKIKPANINGVNVLKLSLVDQGSSNPTGIQHINTLGTIVLTRQVTGHYRITSSGLFTLGKTFILLSPTSVVNSPNITYYQTDASNIEIYARNNAGALTDSMLSEDDTYTNILIEVYQ